MLGAQRLMNLSIDVVAVVVRVGRRHGDGRE
jgi:hypothetical protein